MISQSNDFDIVPTGIMEFVASKVKVLDQYVLMQTGETEYTALVHDSITGETVSYVFRRTGNYQWTVECSQDAEWSVSVLNEYYVYSNVGYGSMLQLPVHEAMTAHGVGLITIFLLLAVLFKGLLFPRLLGSRRRR